MKLSISSYQAKPQSKHGDTFYSDWPENREPSQNIWPDCKTINALQARAFGHSEPAARKARLIAVAFEQLPHKTPLDRPRELAKIDQDVRALSEMMGVR